MEQEINLKQLERKAWKSYHQDGLWDVFFGILLLSLGVTALTNSNTVHVVLTLAALAVFFCGKRFVTVPRMGLVAFGAERKAKKTKIAAVLTLTFVLGVALYIVVTLSSGAVEWMRDQTVLFPLGVGVMMLAVFTLMGCWMDFGRMYFIGLVFALAFTGMMLLHNPIVFFVAGTVVLLPGLFIFVRFLRRYPLPPGPEAQESR
jgi:cytochrome bd-type quinol oxidase subunit 2